MLAFLKRLPQPLVAHDYGVDDAVLIEGELVLLEDAHLLRRADRPFLRRQFARQQLHEGGLAGAVRPGEAVAAALLKSGGDVVEQDLRPVPHGDVGD